MSGLLPTHPWLWPAAFAVMMFGARYMVLAGLAFSFARPTTAGGWGRPHAGAPVAMNYRLHIRRELQYSALTVLVFGLVNAVIYGWGWLPHSLLYHHMGDYPQWWFWLSIPVMLFLHDSFFYWGHRAMHSRLLFATMHRVHHQSRYPTAFAAYSFHPTEALAEALMVTAIIFLIPVHPIAFLIFQSLSTLYNVYGHCGREFFPSGTARHPVGRWLNTSTAHAYHHGEGRANYGLYFLLWDRWMKTDASL